MIKNLTLKNFRKFKDISLDFDSNLVVLYGDNAKGKSTILEAISMISDGRSPWAQTDDMINNEQTEDDRHMRIEITREDQMHFVFFKDNNRRQHQINEKRTTSRKFFNENSATIFNPEQIEILMISPSERRLFLDDIIARTDYSYNETLTNFKKVLRQRNSYLKKLSKLFYENGTVARNDPVLSIWTAKFADLSSEITKQRSDICKALSADNFEIEYVSEISDFDNIHKELEEKMEKNKKKDIATGYTNTGAHREDWQIFDRQDIKKYGSRGQKRLAIGKLIFRIQEVLAEKNGFYPTLLLDDISSELDSENIKSIFNKQLLKKQQTFVTIINPKNLPKEILDSAQIIDLSSF